MDCRIITVNSISIEIALQTNSCIRWSRTWQLIYLIKEMIKLFKTYINQPHELTNGSKLETEDSDVILLFVMFLLF